MLVIYSQLLDIFISKTISCIVITVLQLCWICRTFCRGKLTKWSLPVLKRAGIPAKVGTFSCWLRKICLKIREIPENSHAWLRQIFLKSGKFLMKILMPGLGHRLHIVTRAEFGRTIHELKHAFAWLTSYDLSMASPPHSYQGRDRWYRPWFPRTSHLGSSSRRRWLSLRQTTARPLSLLCNHI